MRHSGDKFFNPALIGNRMDLVDVHAHLDLVEDLPAVLRRARANGIRTIITQGVNHETNIAALQLAQEHDIVEAALGIYPCEASSVDVNSDYERHTTHDVDETLQFIEEHASKCIALGEVGMDFKESCDKRGQIDLFRRIVRMAKRLKKPIIVHSRKAEEEILDILEDESFTRIVMHCFMGSKRLLERGIEMGLYFSIPSAVVRIDQFQMNAELVPLRQLFVETDTPYLGMMRGLPSEPAHVRDAVLEIARIKRLEPQEMANQIYFNFQKLFQ